MPTPSADIYLYAIARADAVSADGTTGVKDQPLEVVPAGPVAAVVSPAPEGRLRPRRRNLKAHHDVLKALMEQDTILPMAFGVLADSRERVTGFLTNHVDRLTHQLDRVDGQAEVGLRVKWKVDDIFAHFVARYDSLREMRDAFFGNGASASRQEMIQLGERFQELLEAERNAHLSTIEEALNDAVTALQADEPRDETEVLNVACLVPRDGIEAFESAVNDAAAQFDDHFLFTYTDPMAPYSFADVDFNEGTG